VARGDADRLDDVVGRGGEDDGRRDAELGPLRVVMAAAFQRTGVYVDRSFGERRKEFGDSGSGVHGAPMLRHVTARDDAAALGRAAGTRARDAARGTMVW